MVVAGSTRYGSTAAREAAPSHDDLPREHGFEPLVIEGALPPELSGTLYRNGPGLFGQFSVRYTHPFEADGAITAIRIGGGRAWGACRITATAGLLEERAAGSLRYGLAAPWPRRFVNTIRGRHKNTANTSVVVWQDRLFALLEIAKPTEIDPRDLSTLGETDLAGAVIAGFSAHPRRVVRRGAIYNFGVEYGRKTRLHLYELPDLGAARRLGAVELAGPAVVHDFCATETHLVFFISPVRVNSVRMLLSIGPFHELFRWRPELGAEVICVPIDGAGDIVRFTTDAFFQWHFANGFTRGGELIIDYVRYPAFDSFEKLGALSIRVPPVGLDGRAHRATINLAGRSLRTNLLLDRTCEFPTVAPSREGSEYGATYLVVDDAMAIGRLDHATGALDVHELPRTQRATEPCFVARAGARSETDGWILSLCHDGPSDRAFLAVYDAHRLSAGPVACAWFDHQIPITFHGTFLADRR